MPTRSEIRDSVRFRLEDIGPDPLWYDATLNDLIADAVRRYGARFPAERTATVALSSGDQAIPLPEIASGDQVLRVLDPAGIFVPRLQTLETQTSIPAAQEWRWWNGEVRLQLGAAAGDWRIEYRGERVAPTDDVMEVDIVPGDDEIIVLMTAAAALQRRAIEDAKRGLTRGVSAISSTAQQFDAACESRIRARKRQPRMTWSG